MKIKEIINLYILKGAHTFGISELKLDWMTIFWQHNLCSRYGGGGGVCVSWSFQMIKEQQNRLLASFVKAYIYIINKRSVVSIYIYIYIYYIYIYHLLCSLMQSSPQTSIISCYKVGSTANMSGWQLALSRPRFLFIPCEAEMRRRATHQPDEPLIILTIISKANSMIALVLCIRCVRGAHSH